MSRLNLVTDTVIESSNELTLRLHKLRKKFNQDPSPSITTRKKKLNTLKKAILANEQALVEGLSADFGLRSEFDSVLTDLLPTIGHINYTVKHLSKWMKPSRRKAGLLLSPSKVEVRYQPVGVVGVISPWNFPVILSLAPVATALAAGNKVMLKLSEFTPRTNAVIVDILGELTDDIDVVIGGVAVATQFSELKFDHLLFTGSTKIGRLVAQAAARNLTPVTLELGGKSPVIVTPSAKLERIIDEIIFGKCINGGQICVAPDYVLIEQDRVDAFATLFIERFKQLYANQEISHIINRSQFERLVGYIEQAKQTNARVISIKPASINQENHQFWPHLILNPSHELDLMKEEIFGPILPIVPYTNIDDAIAYINQGERPLAMYIMAQDKQSIEYILQRTHSGGVAINDTIVHVGAEDAPFGGIGESGIGHYHGEEGFKTFSHARTVLTTPAWLPRAGLILKHQARMLSVLKTWFIK